jgi:hypothetical protein
METYHEGMVDLLQNIDLRNGKFDLFVHDQFFFLEYFQRICLVVFGTSGQKYLPKRTFAKLFNKPKVSQL